MRLAAVCVLCAVTPGMLAAQAPASWVLADVRAATDNQPRSALRLSAEYGRFITPSFTLAAIAAFEHGLAGVQARADAGTGRLSVSSAAGALIGADDGLHALWDVTAGVALGADLSLRAGSQRTRYTATAVSTDTAVMQRRVFIALDRAAAPGVAGEVQLRRDDYGDANPVRTAFAWLLAPLSRGSTHSLRAGYAVSWQDTDESRWQPDDERRGPPRGPNATLPDSIPGRYNPYHTPHDLLIHSVLAQAAVKARSAWFTVDASWGVHATELAPVVLRVAAPPAEPGLFFYERSFSPLEVRAALAAPIDNATSLTATAAHRRTAFYRESAITMRVARSLGTR